MIKNNNGKEVKRATAIKKSKPANPRVEGLELRVLFIDCRCLHLRIAPLQLVSAVLRPFQLQDRPQRFVAVTHHACRRTIAIMFKKFYNEPLKLVFNFFYTMSPNFLVFQVSFK